MARFKHVAYDMAEETIDQTIEKIIRNDLTFDEAMTQIGASTNKNATALDLFGKRGATVATIIANNVTEIDIPLLVVQGENDPRVPVTESEQVVEALRNEDKTVWYMNAFGCCHSWRRTCEN